MDAVSGLQQVRGVITLVQEDRFRLQLADGRSLPFVAGKAAGLSLGALESLAESGSTVLVSYRGDIDAGGVADFVVEVS